MQYVVTYFCPQWFRQCVEAWRHQDTTMFTKRYVSCIQFNCALCCSSYSIVLSGFIWYIYQYFQACIAGAHMITSVAMILRLMVIMTGTKKSQGSPNHEDIFCNILYIICLGWVPQEGYLMALKSYSGLGMLFLLVIMWSHWTSKMLVRYILSSQCLRLSQFSQSCFIQYMRLCVFSLPNSLVMIVRMCTLSYYHHIRSMNH